MNFFLHDNKTNLWLLGSFSKSFLFYKFSIHFVQLDPHNKEKNSTKPWNTLDTEVQKFCIADKAVLSAPPSSHSLQNENERKKKKKIKKSCGHPHSRCFGVSTFTILFSPQAVAL